MNDAIMIIIMKNCNDFQVHRCIEYMRELEAAKDQGSSRLQTFSKLLLVIRPYLYYFKSLLGSASEFSTSKSPDVGKRSIHFTRHNCRILA